MMAENGNYRNQTSKAGLARELPYNLEAEEALLGSMLLSREAVADAIQIVEEQDFFRPAHTIMFKAIKHLYANGDAVDAVTVLEELRRRGQERQIGGPGTLVDIQSKTPAATNAQQYAKIVSESSLLRQLIKVAGEISELAYDSDREVRETLDHAEALIFSLAEKQSSDTIRRIYELLELSINKLEELSERNVSITGLSTGFHDLDECLSGLQPSNLIIVGARPSMGKTSFALNIAANAVSEESGAVMVVSLEMSHDEIMQRLLCSEGLIDAMKLRNGRLDESDWKRITEVATRLGDKPLFIDDNPNATVMDIRAKARRLAAQNGLALVVVDYLQLMTGRSSAENRQVEVAEISRGLKILARELNVPVIALSQLSRNLENRSDKRPMLADLRESGSLEQDADVVLLLYRDEVYNPQSPDVGIAEVHVAKHRNGPTRNVKLVFRQTYARFDNLAKGY